jgi:FixJ family two-component response regulator
MSDPAAVVFVVDDDSSMRDALTSLMRSVGMSVQAFESASAFLAAKRPDLPSCLVLDVRLPGLSGLDLQRELLDAGEQIPVIFITGHGDIPMTVRAMKAGAVEFLPKPFREQDLLAAVGQALHRDDAARGRRAEAAEVRVRLGTLTARERQVMERALAGLLNRQIAAELGVSEVTVKVHRRHLMQKMSATSLVELSRMIAKIA